MPNTGVIESEKEKLDIRPEDLNGTFEQKKALVSHFNLMDDIFFSVVMENKSACEYLLSRLMGMNVRIVENKTQFSLRSLTGHSAELDLLVKDDDGKLYDVEIQGIDEHDHERRMRYYISLMDQSFLKKGAKYSELPETYVIFISKFDPFKLDKTHYEIEQTIGGTNKPFNDGVHKHYFNTAVDDGTPLAELMQYLAKSDPNNDKFGYLSQAVRYHKVSEKGVESMCEPLRTLIEESVVKAEAVALAKGKAEGRLEGKAEGRLEGKAEAILLMIDNLMSGGDSLDKALRVARIDKETYYRYKELYGGGN